MLYRTADLGPEVLLGHIGGPFWARKDDVTWSFRRATSSRARRRWRPTADDPASADLFWPPSTLGGTQAQLAIAHGDYDNAINAVDQAVPRAAGHARRGPGLTMAFKVEALALRGDAAAAAAEFADVVELIATNPAPRAIARLRDLRSQSPPPGVAHCSAKPTNEPPTTGSPWPSEPRPSPPSRPGTRHLGITCSQLLGNSKIAHTPMPHDA
ncbi:hypothetical protein BCD48_32920 [Pseudofrankia sp. BMG5.36]|nr:hypothetical protein BCD48_32920 [Pseudofrankia sp. BMG5.36]